MSLFRKLFGKNEKPLEPRLTGDPWDKELERGDSPNYYARGSIMDSFRGRDLEIYIHCFNINLRDLEGKTILDLGAGLNNLFAEGLKLKGVDSEVVSLSPDWSEKDITEITRKASPEGRLVAGLGQALPFKDECFDLIYSLHVYDHIQSHKVLVSILGEMARTLKRGGQAKMGRIHDVPYYYNRFEQYSNDPEIIEILNRYGVAFTREDVSPDLPLCKVKDQFANAFYVRSYSLVLNKK